MSSNPSEKSSLTNDESEEVCPFDGKIVYNPNGSAYILEDDDDELYLPRYEGSIVDRPGESPACEEIPPIENAFYVSRNVASSTTAIINNPSRDNPIVHSYRVYSSRNIEHRKKHREELSETSVPIKPILMCFVCKLSFGCVKTFNGHAVKDHEFFLNEDEKSYLDSKNSSAIIQMIGKNKEVVVSFLEPSYPPSELGAIAKVSLLQESSSFMDESRERSPDRELANMMAMHAAAVAASNSPHSPHSPFPTNANMLQGTTIGVCPDHVNGRSNGVECSKCDLILNMSRMPGGIAWNTTRNSCKTLKCPKCNWHYKYQETLEIHMKEKHPENETTCIYCLTGQAHPRLARGETYNCGYKPYRCEVCNYSTTTKGNLSIHMQSDKHLNNMQELQNGSGIPGSGSENTSSTTPVSESPIALQASPVSFDNKPNWKCDICNYETNVARNLRIHMTSEKHTANVMSHQQNKNMQQLSALQMVAGNNLDSKQLFHFQQGFGLLAAAAAAAVAASTGSSNSTDSLVQSGGEASAANFADMAYNQAFLSQLLQNHSSSLNLSSYLLPEMNKEEESPREGESDPNPRSLFNCCVCRQFGCDEFDSLSAHLSIDRSKTREHEISMVISGNYLCQLCNYKTNLKANFQLHCKTDKHLQRLNHVNHIKEGGFSNEWKLRFLSNINPVEIKCNACDFFTNSPHKLQVHTSSQQHQVSCSLFHHLMALEKSTSKISSSSAYKYDCLLCKFSSKGKAGLLTHTRTVQHLQMEQFMQIQKRVDGNTSQIHPGDIFQVKEIISEEDESRISSSDKIMERNCPLCQDLCTSQEELENHAISVHSVNSEGIQRLQSLIHGSRWLKSSENDKEDLESEEEEDNDENEKRFSKTQEENDLEEDNVMEIEDETKTTPENSFQYSYEKYLDPNRPHKCEVCKESFTQKNILLVHYNSVSHLHRLKKSMTKNNDSVSVIPTPEKSPSKGSALEALLGCIKGDRQGREEEEVKAFKCNICKVSYSVGSSLDIHIRSVLHQTKASKLQELILSGQIDLSKPLIEQPETASLQENAKKMMSELLSPKSLNSTSSSSTGGGGGNIVSSPKLLTSSSVPVSPSSSPLTYSTKEESEETNILNKMLKNLQEGGGSKKSSPVLKNLLQNYGFDLVKQYQCDSFQRDSEERKNEEEEVEEEVENENDNEEKKKENENNEKNEFEKDEDEIMCSLCNKKFSNFSSLSTHVEEFHKSFVKMSNENERQSPKDSVSLNTAPNLLDMQEALQRAMMTQMNPMMLQMAQLQGLNPLAAMNMYPPLLPPALLQTHSPGMLDPKILALMAASKKPEESNSHFLSSRSNLFSGPDGKSNLHTGQSQSQMIQSSGASNSGAQDGKRARTRISDDQLKILRSHFDINNSPSEATLNMMSQHTGLPLKVIKHWFRNTLFKERQKNKDSPYNFSNPPSTKLNLEEYEKSGETKTTPLQPEEQGEYVMKEIKKENEIDVESSSTSKSLLKPVELETLTGSSEKVLDESLSRLLSGKQTPHSNLLPNFPVFPTNASAMPPMPNYLTTLANRMSAEYNNRPLSPLSGGSSSAGGKRANRTRFTDYQIKVLQEFFENNAYPKDDDLEYLSKLLGLSPRVIVVWFQNARQKARKIYENQPPIDPTDDGAGRFTRTPGLNYQCKKCLLVFQRYYELIRHQKQHCFKEEDAKRSAQAQKAAANAAAQFSNSPGAFQSSTPHSEDSNSSLCGERGEIESPLFNQSNSSLPPPETNRRSFDVSEEWHSGPSDNSSFPQIFRTKREDEETRKITPSMFDQLIREDPFSKFINPLGSGPSCFPNYPHSSPFGLLQQPQPQSGSSMTAMVRDGGDSYDDLDNESLGSSPSSCKRKLSEDGDCDDKDEGGAHRDKRLRTTILPEQLDFLYQKYQIESNPSRKMLEQIANEVGLRKRVVQVWFQNTRARERKGQFRAHQQVINKRCPYCPALFKVRSALESHLSSKHNDQNHKGEINIDALPDVEGFHEDGESGRNIVLTPNSCVSGLTPGTSELEESMRKYYEDTMKRYMNDLANHQDSVSSPSLSSLRESGQKAALDLSDSPALDLTKSCNEENGFWDKEARSDVISLGDNQSCDFEEDEEDQSGDENKQGSFLNKRYRTQMSSLQIKMIKSVFSFYKTPNMAECSALGREIGLPKRVVQVWFQNARAKEKKAKLHFVQIVGNEERQENEFDEEDEQNIFPSECKLCNFQISADSISFPEHLFSKAHQDNVRRCISEGKYHPQSPGDAIAEATAAIAHIRSRNTLSCSSPSFSQISSSEKTSSGSREEIEKTLMQHLYGVGHGISSYPTGVATANPFLHPAMFSASGK